MKQFQMVHKYGEIERYIRVDKVDGEYVVEMG